jgi:predicted Zn finger-like uncharacterized protein
VRVEVQCGKCFSKYLLDLSTLPEGGARVVCKNCGHRWDPRALDDLDAPAAAEAPAMAVTAAAAAGRAPGATAAGRGGAGAAAGASAEATGRAAGPGRGVSVAASTEATASGGILVKCPGCGLRFVPQARHATFDPDSSVAASISSALPAAPAALKGSAARTILIAEDVEFFTTLAINALGKKYRTITVPGVEETLRAVRSEKIDLLVLDLTLKDGRDGREVLRALGDKSFPVLIFTSGDEVEMYGERWEELKRLGADDLLLKGMNVEENLLAKVGSLLARKR